MEPDEERCCSDQLHASPEAPSQRDPSNRRDSRDNRGTYRVTAQRSEPVDNRQNQHQQNEDRTRTLSTGRANLPQHQPGGMAPMELGEALLFRRMIPLCQPAPRLGPQPDPFDNIPNVYAESSPSFFEGLDEGQTEESPQSEPTQHRRTDQREDNNTGGISGAFQTWLDGRR